MNAKYLTVIADMLPAEHTGQIYELIQTAVLNGDVVVTTDAISNEWVIRFVLALTPPNKKSPLVLFSLSGPDGSGKSALQLPDAAMQALKTGAEVHYFQGTPHATPQHRLKAATDAASAYKFDDKDSSGIVVLWHGASPHVTTMPPASVCEMATKYELNLFLFPFDMPNSHSLPLQNVPKGSWQRSKADGVWSKGLLWVAN